MQERDLYKYEDEDPWEGVQLTKEAIRARARLLLYTALLTAPFVAMVALCARLCGLKPHEVLGVTCYYAMVSAIFFFDTLRNAAHDCFDTAEANGQVTYNEGIPIIDPAYPRHRLALLAFAIGGRGPRKILDPGSLRKKS